MKMFDCFRKISCHAKPSIWRHMRKVVMCWQWKHLKDLEYLALFDPLEDEHLDKIHNNKMMVYYVEKKIQYELIQPLANSIKEKNLAKANLLKYFSNILACTPDVSHVEQMSIIVRFVDTKVSTEVRKRHASSGIIAVKPLSSTRWESRIDALKPLKCNFANVYNALIEILEDKRLVGSSGNDFCAEAHGLAVAISKFKFVMCFVLCNGAIFFEVNLTSKMLE